ncbi:SIS domain-containing protein [Synechococcus sp. A15-28]|uniref:SIS domain-containing protein n=1 Tax=Synechococcus sp. A15-28 TaxID=1050638 RepID=UPI001644AC7E|nr:SIS domain-containing protein [Synechococcus sp. A15-28]
MVLAKNYLQRLISCTPGDIEEKITKLINEIDECRKNNNVVYICGNGGSAANALHISNDLHYGACKNAKNSRGIKVEALASNTSILTCLGNDLGYEQIFSHQVERKGMKGDMLLVLSGSGNSKNIINAIEVGRKKEMKTIGIFGYDGGICKNLVDIAIHFDVNDMQISEDWQLIVGHICMQEILIRSKQG